ncbi:filamentous hemagglutinin N-terminal domain-containing protein [Kovacikia minuta CCNUW1]|uniref:two-partner secretion domain-containing protein n=1 Tax=Kovacikia minuta TaxID=2931930 RepID=UPI001CCE6236|nr:filamentous hemagglutinin N-terminal domain-containing protein [Kovacikia minuta]UBF25072.1 filamentous hemagglutinin N-terminal domain-containing protein [Kovacikia minuta CCNUW1]
MRWVIRIAQIAGSILWVSLPVNVSTQAQQIVPDTTLGNESSVLRTNVNVNGSLSDRIDGGARRGSNLFHSFSEFGVREGQRVYFNNPAGVINILGRVTGSNLSNILGTLGVTGGTANLFLINPNGILFGQNARLDVGGSFVASTARSLTFADGTQFVAAPAQSQPLLTISTPIGLQFGTAPQAISVIGLDGLLSNLTGLGLRVPNGKTLALIGGNVTLEGGLLTAPGGHVELGGLAGAGTVGLSDSNGSLRLRFPPNVEWANVSLTSSVNRFPDEGGPVRIGGNNSGDNISINANVLLLNGGTFNSTSNTGNSGNIEVNATSVYLRNKAEIDSSNSGGAEAGTVNIQARENVFIEGESTLSSRTDGQGNGGNIRIEAGSLSIASGGRLTSSTTGSGNAGKISLIVRDATTIVNSSINSSAGVSLGGAFGDAGDIEIQTGTLSMTDGAGFFTANTGEKRAGNITINARDSVSLNKSYIFNPNPNNGVSGSININAKSFSSVDSALIVATFGSSDAGSISINTSESVIVSSVNPDLNQLAGIRLTTPGIYTSTTAGGKAGNLTIKTGVLQVRGGARLSASTSGPGEGGALTINAASMELNGTSANGQSPSGLFTETLGAGPAGNMILTVDQLNIQNGAQISASTSGTGRPGDISIRNANSVNLSNGSISTAVNQRAVVNSAEGRGNIEIQTRNLALDGDRAQITASTFGQGDAGNIRVQANSVALNNGASISTAVNQGAIGQGGNINIQTGDIALSNGAQITARTEGQGTAGNITITANTFDATRGGQLRTSTASGSNAGNITLNLRDRLDLSGANTGLFADTEQGSTGEGGSIFIDPRTVMIRDGARIAVNSEGFGRGGDIYLQAGRLTLDNQAKISAETASNQGGNITPATTRPPVAPRS